VGIFHRPIFSFGVSDTFCLESGWVMAQLKVRKSIQGKGE